MEKIYIDREIANDLVWKEFDPNYEFVHKEQTGEGRLEAQYTLVIKRKADGKLFGAPYRLGLTEDIERRPFEKEDANSDDEIEFVEFKEVEVVKKIYIRANDNNF